MAGLQQQLVVAHIKHKIIADNGARIRDEAVRFLTRDASKEDECLNVRNGVYGFGGAPPVCQPNS